MIKNLYLSILILFSTNFLFSQIDNNRYRIILTSDDVGVCGNNNSLSTVQVTGKNASCNSFEISFDLPNGINYVPSTLIITSQSGSSDYTISEVNITNLNEPIFSLLRPNNINWAVGDIITFTFERDADCDAVQFFNNAGVFKDAHTINFNDINGNSSFTDANLSIASYNIDAASLSIQAIPLINANVGGSYSRTIDLDQGGTGNISQMTYYTVVGSDLQNYTLSYNGTILTPSATSGDTLFFDINLNVAPFNTGNGLFELGERISLLESFDVIGCQNTTVRHHCFWGCNPGEICQSAPVQEGILNFGVATPQIGLTELAGTPDFCSPTTFRVRIQNTNTIAGGTALNVDINLGLGHNQSPLTNPTSNPLWAFDHQNTRSVSNFFFDNGTVFSPTTKPSTIYPGNGSGNSVNIPPDFLTSDPDGLGVGLEDLDNDGFYDDLAPGASTILNFDYTTNPKSNCGESTYFSYMEWEHVYFDVNYQDQCYGDRTPNRVDLDYTNVIRDYLNPTLIDAPTDVNNNDNFNIRIKPHMYIGLACNGGSGVSGADVTWTTTLTVTNGITLQPGAPANFSQTGNTITYTSSAYSYSYIDFPLSYICQPGDCGSATSINYTTNYKCGTCWDQDIHCGTIEFVTHCNCPCNGISTTLFNAERVSEGWTNTSMTSYVTLNNSFSLDNYLAGDTMAIYTKGIINNSSLDNLGLDIRFTASAGGGGSNALTFVKADIQIYDNSTGTFSTSASFTTAPTITSTGDDHLHSYDLSSYRSLIANSNFDNNDSILVTLTYIIPTSIGASALYNLETFRGNFFTTVTGNKSNCNDLGDVASYGKISLSVYNYISYSNLCTNSSTEMFLTHQSSFGDLHPGEYRPPTIWDSCSLILPTGARFAGNAEWIGGGGYSIAGGDIGFTQRGDTVTFFPQVNFTNLDQGGTTYKRFRAYFVGTCDTPPTSNYTMKHYYKDFGYGNQIPTVRTDTDVFSYTPPTFLFQSPSPLVKGNGNEAIFDTEICNSSSIAINNNWIEVEPNSNINIIGAYEVVGGVETPINYIQSGGFTYIEAGSLAVAECKDIRFKVTFSNCNSETLIVKHGWDCSQYPLDYSAITSVCYQDSIIMTLDPQEGQIQLSITNQPTSVLTLCTPFNIEMDVISAQIADIINPYITFSIPGGASGLTINSIQVEYPLNSGAAGTFPVTFTISSLGLAQINLYDHPNIAAQIGIKGTSNSVNTDERTAHIVMNLQLECDYVSNSTIRFKAYAKSPCGSPALGNGTQVVSDGLLIDGALPPYDAFSTITNLTPVGNTQAFNIVTTIIGGTTGIQDSAFIELPAGLTYIPNSFSANGANIAVFSSVYTVGNHQEILIKYPAGVPHNGTIDFSFNTTVNHSVCSETRITNFVTINGISCLSINCVDPRVLTGFSYENIQSIYVGLAGNNQDLCSIYTTTLNGLAPPLLETGTWSIDSSFTQPNSPIFLDSSINNTAISNLIEGQYKLVWVVSNGTCSPVSDTITINVFDQPTAIAGGDIFICNEDSTVLNATQPMGTSTGLWSINNAVVQPSIVSFSDVTQFNSTIYNIQEGIYSLVWTVSNGNCNISRDTLTVTHYNQPIANAGGNQKLCEDFSTLLTGNSPIGSSNGYWMLDTNYTQPGHLTFNDSTLYNAQISNLSLGSYQLIWTLENGTCTPSKDTVIISVYNFPIANAGQDSLIKCEPPTIVLNGLSSSSGTNYQYLWTTSNGVLESDITTLSPIISLGGDYTLTVLDTISGCVNSDSVNIFQDDSVYVSILLNNSSDSTAEVNTYQEYEYTYTGNDGPVIWSIDDINISNDSTLIHSFIESGQHIVSITLTNPDNGCIANDSLILTAIHQLKIPGAISPNGDGFNDYFLIRALENYDDNTLTIFNRWGNSVFEASPYENNWEGQSNSGLTVTGEIVVDGTYFYVLKLTKDNQEFIYKGSIEVKR